MASIVICVDDDATIRSIIRFALQRHGCRDVVQAHSGADALDLCSGREFDLLICDYQMSPMNGLDLLRELRQLGICQSCPVLMLSAETNPETIEAARAFGVAAWIGKPISAQSLIEQVGAVLRPRGQLGPMMVQNGQQLLIVYVPKGAPGLIFPQKPQVGEQLAESHVGRQIAHLRQHR